MKTIEAFGKIEKGEMVIFNQEVFWQQIMDIGFANHIHLTVEYGNKRTHDQNSYAFAVFDQMATRMRQDGWDVSSYEIYKKVEETYSKVEKVNPKNGEVVEFTKPLKKQDTERFGEIIGQVRQNFMERYPDTYIKEPHEYYEMSFTAYDRWKRGELTKTEAIKESN